VNTWPDVYHMCVLCLQQEQPDFSRPQILLFWGVFSM